MEEALSFLLVAGAFVLLTLGILVLTYARKIAS